MIFQFSNGEFSDPIATALNVNNRVLMPIVYLRTFARNFSNIDFFLKILPLKDHELAMSEM